VRPETSIPTSSSASTTASCSSAAGRDPAERASPPRRSYSAAAYLRAPGVLDADEERLHPPSVRRNSLTASGTSR
jgi:hypothetical protein